MLCTFFVDFISKNMPELHENATLIERLQYYVNFDNPKKARALARVADFLEECYLWDLDFYGTNYEN